MSPYHRPMATHALCQTTTSSSDARASRDGQQVRTLTDAATLFFRFPSPRLILLFFLGPAGARAWLGGYGWADAAIVAAIALYWPLQEWWMHKYILHLRPFRLFGRTFDPVFAQKHRLHHRTPWNIATTFLPGPVVVLAFVVSVTSWRLAMPTLELALTGIAAYSLAALVYEWVHFLTHTSYRPKTAYYARIRRGHRLHHFKNERYWYGFTVPLVDRALRTAPDHRTVETSDTCHTLGVAGADDEGER